MTAIDTLESQLLEYWQNQETQKTWDQWNIWLDQMGISLPSATHQRIASHEKINYQRFLNLCEKELNQFPEWVQKLTNPDWLHEHHLIVIPEKIFQSEKAELSLMKQQIAQLSQSLKSLQKQVSILENQTATRTPRMDSAPVSSSPSREVSQNGLKKAQLMEKELTIHQLSKKNKAPLPPEDGPPETEPQPLEEVYLSFNDWYHQFLKSGFDLQELTSSSIWVDSKRPISFKQFGRRIEQKIEDKPLFQDIYQEFASQHTDGIVLGPDSERIAAVSPETEPSTSEEEKPQSEIDSLQQFQLPPPDMYRGFNDWLEWLKRCGIDPHEFASQDLKVPSTRHISFQQFCRRLERKLDDVESFRNAIHV